MAELAAVGATLNADEIDLFEGAVRGALPFRTFSQDYWHSDGVTAFFCLVSDRGEAQVCIGLRGDASGSGLIMDAGYLALDASLQRKGLAKLLARRLLWAADDLGAGRIVTVANLDVGSYAWAAFAARPAQPAATETLLRQRVRQLVTGGDWSAHQGTLVAPKLNASANLDFMNDIAQTSDGTRDLGFELLSEHPRIGPFKWDAYWDLNDPAHRAHINTVLR